MTSGLDGLVVLEITDTLGAAFAVSLLADCGAEAIVCEPPEGSRLRDLGFGELDTIRWQVLARNKRSVFVERPEMLDALLRRADLLVTDTAAPNRAQAWWFPRFDALPESERPLLVEVFPTGADRPDLWPSNILPEFAAAASGVMALTGHTGKTPILAEAPLADYLAGTLAATRALTEVRGACLAGESPAPVATPLHQALFRMIEWQMPVATALGRAETRMGNNFPMNAGIANMHPTGDARYVAISAVTQATAIRLMTMVGGPTLAADPRFATPEARSRGLAALYDKIDAWTGARTTAEILKTAAEQDVVLGPVYTTEQIVADEQVCARRSIVHLSAGDGTTVPMPAIVPRITGFPNEIWRAGSAVGADTDAILSGLAESIGGAGLRARLAAKRQTAPPSGREGPPHHDHKKLLVVELGAVIAGPFAGSMMAELGGTVIKVESPDAGNSLRKMGPAKNGAPIWFGTSAREKLCVTLNLKHQDGKALFLRLISTADVLVENFRPGVLERLGLGWETLHAANSRLIMLSISGFGQTGPQAGRPGFGKIAEGLSGIVNLTGEAGKPPLYVGFSLADASAGLFGVYGVAAALFRRDVLGSGTGARVDLALFEPLMRMLDCQLALQERLGRPPERGGTNDPYSFGLTGKGRSQFRCIEIADRWFMLAFPAGADADALATQWSALPLPEALAAAKEAGVPICPVFDGASLAETLYFEMRGDRVAVEDEAVGRLSAPGRIDGAAGPVFRAPALGEANRTVFGDMLGLSDADMAQLAADGAI